MRRMKNKEVKRGKEKRRKKRTKRRESKEDVSVLFRWRLFEIFSQGEGLRELLWFFLGGPVGEALSDFEPDTRLDVSAVPVVTDVLVSPSSVVTEFCVGFPFLL